MASETALRKLLADRIHGEDPDAHVRQVENAAGSGDPDTYICFQGHSVWVELKYIEPPKRPTTPIRGKHIRTAQLLWAADHLRADGIVWFLVQVGKVYYLLNARTAARLKSGIPPGDLWDQAVAVWCDGLPWDVMHKLLELPCRC